MEERNANTLPPDFIPSRDAFPQICDPQAAGDTLRKEKEMTMPYISETEAQKTIDILLESDKLITSLKARLTALEAVALVQNSALSAVVHDRPTAHSDGIWLQVNQALDAYKALT